MGSVNLSLAPVYASPAEISTARNEKREVDYCRLWSDPDPYPLVGISIIFTMVFRSQPGKILTRVNNTVDNSLLVISVLIFRMHGFVYSDAVKLALFGAFRMMQRIHRATLL